MLSARKDPTPGQAERGRVILGTCDVLVPRPGAPGVYDPRKVATARIVADVVDEGRLAAVQLALERLGAVEMELTDLALSPGTEADYVLDPAGDPHAVGDAAARLSEEVTRAGFDVVVPDAFPWRVVHPERLEVTVEAGEEADWFELHLGVEVDGTYVDLLPAVIDLVSTRGLALPRGRRHLSLPLGDGRYVTMPRERVERLLQIVRELYEVDGTGPGGGVRIPAYHPGYLDAVRAAAGRDLGPRGARRTAESPHAPQAGAKGGEEDLPPGTVRAALRPYQRAGVAWLSDLFARGVGGVLADDMGLGKTLQTIAHLARVRDARVGPPHLVVAPTSLLGNWQREIARFAPQLRTVVLHGSGRKRRFEACSGADVILTTYALLVRDLGFHTTRPYGVVVVDEAQMVKNPRSQAHAAIRALDAQQVVCLSGTPVENDLEELRALFDLCVPGLLGNRATFRAAYADPIEREGDAEKLAALRRRVGPFVLRRVKSQVAPELPPKIEAIHPVHLGAAQRDLYESIRIAAHGAVRKAIREKGLSGAKIDILSALTKLRQVCCDPRLLPMRGAQVEESAKLDALLTIVETLRAEGRRTLVFSQFTSMLDLIARALDARRIGHLALTGRSRRRQDLVDRFERGEGDVFLISLKAGGAGLNLTSADTVIHYDPWWNPAAQRQATDRAYRIGQTRPVHVYELIVEGSVESRMLALKRRKQAIADGLFDESAGSGFSADDVEALLSPLAPAGA